MLTVVKQNKWKTAIISSFIALLLILPYILQYAVKTAILDYTKPYGIEQVDLSDLSLNLFKGTLSIHQLELYKKPENSSHPSQKSVIHIKQLGIDFEWLPLFKKHLSIQGLSFNDANLPFKLDDQNRLYLANIPLFSEQTKTASENSSSTFLPGLDNVEFNNIQLSLAHQSKTTTFTINHLSLNHLYAWSNHFGRLQFKALLNNQPVQANLQLHLFSEHPKVVGTLKTNALDLGNFSQFIKNKQLNVQGKLTSDITFTFEQTDLGPKLFEQGQILLHDFAMNQTEVAVNKTTPNDSPTPKADNTKSSLQAAFNNLSWKGDLLYSQDKNDQKIDLDGTLSLQKLLANQGKKNIAIASTSLAGKSQITLGKTINVNANEKLNLTGLSLQDKASQQALLTDISATLNTKVNIDDDKIKINHKGDLTLKNLSGSQQDLLAKLQQFKWDGLLNVTSDKTVTIQSTGKLALNQFNLANSQRNTTITQINKANIANFSLQSLDDIKLSKLNVNGFSLGEPVKQKNKQPGLVKIQNIAVNTLNYQKQNTQSFIDIGQVVINGSQTHISLNKDGKITQLESLLAALPTTSSKDAEQTNKPITKTKTTKEKPIIEKPINEKQNTEQSNLNYQIAGLTITGNNPITLIDQQTTPVMQQTVQIKNLKVGKIASKSPLKATQFALNIAFDEFSKLTSKGVFTPLKPTHEFNANTNLDGLPLTRLSPLVEHKVGYEITSGQLTAELKTDIKHNTIKAQNELHFNKLELEQADSEKTDNLNKGFPIPLQTGLAMLQDKNDNIELSLPIEGDLSQPDFNINDVISTALGSALAGATRTYLLLALQPFGAIALAGEYALDKASAITLQPVKFINGSDKITPEMQTYLTKIQGLLKERKAIQIKLCGGVTETDRIALKQLAIKQAIAKQTKQPTDKTPTNSDNKQTINVPDIKISNAQLLHLAEERQKNIKRYLLKLGVTGGQVFICKPKIIKDSTNDKTNGQVKLTI
ncbi:hypothetical protein JCM30760_25180 [Thiomicrorhabdus hydrogeniphila]